LILSDFGKKYLLLGLRIDKHINGYVDSYFGPNKIFEKVKSEDITSPKLLLNICKDLKRSLKDQGYFDEVNTFLQKMLDSIEVTLEMLNGKKFNYLEQVKRLYDISPEYINDAIFYNNARRLDSLLNGMGNLQDRIRLFRSKNSIPQEILKKLFIKALDIVRERTLELFPNLLPSNEKFTIELVNNKPWGAYNWYLGNFISKIELNLDTPVEWTNLLTTAAHEGYPGHHTETSIKELILYQNQSRFEHCIKLIPTPESVIAEGIANAGIDVLYNLEQIAEISLNYLCPTSETVTSVINVKDYILIKRNIRGIFNNLALHAYIDEWSDEELIKYGLDFGLWTKIELERYLKFIRDPMWSSYVFTYSSGEKLIKKKYGDQPSPEKFKILLTHPILPSDLE
jgi:hypothetical protein